MVNKCDILHRLYEAIEEPSSYAGVSNILQNARKIDPSIKKKDIIDFLKQQKSYTLHRLTRKHFLRRRIIAPKPGVIASCDLADMSLLSRYNNGYKYILVFIDVFSRFGQAIPLKRKDGNTVHTGLKKIIENNHFNKLRRLNTDEGKEFYNKKVKDMLDSKNITLYSVSSREIKASIAERFIRTIKGKLYRYMTQQNTKKYINILPALIEGYNNSPHRGLGNNQTPIDIHNLKDLKSIQNQFNLMYKNKRTFRKTRISNLTVGEHVRLSNLKPTFKRGYTIQNTVEIFKIRDINKSQSPVVYYLEDLQGEPIKGIFYREELIPVKLPEFYEIDIIRSKIVAGKKKYLVKWRGYPDVFNSWIDEDQLTRT